MIINTLNADRFPLLLTSLIQKLHNKVNLSLSGLFRYILFASMYPQNTRLFSEEEEEKLSNMFGLSSKDIKEVLECLSYTFEQVRSFFFCYLNQTLINSIVLNET